MSEQGLNWAETLPEWLQPTLRSLVHSAEQGSLGHAPMIHGPMGVGKQPLANALAASLLCQHRDPASGMACGKCKSCQVLAHEAHPDFFRLAPEEDKSEIVVDQVRELINQVVLTPALGQHRVVIVSPAEAMNKNAANALLKTLEEPPSGVWLILVCHRPRKLLPTIISRCQRIPIAPPDLEIGRRWVVEQSGSEDPDRVSLALALASGAPFQALEHLLNGHVEQALDVLTTLETIAQGGTVAPGLAQKWAQEAGVIWNALAYWVSQLALASAGLNAHPAVQSLVNKAPEVNWSQIWDSTQDATAVLDRPFRQDLLLGRWLLQFQILTHSSQ